MFFIQLLLVGIGAGLVAIWRLVLHSGMPFAGKLPIYAILVIALIVPLLALDAVISAPFQRYKSPQFQIDGVATEHRAVVFLPGMVNGAEITSRDYRQQFAASFGPTVYADYPRYGFNMSDYVARLWSFLAQHNVNEVRIVAASFGMDVAVSFLRYNRQQGGAALLINGVVEADGMTCSNDLLGNLRGQIKVARLIDGGFITDFITTAGFKQMNGSGHGTHDPGVTESRLVEHENYMFDFPSKGLTGQARAILDSSCPKWGEFEDIRLVDFRCTGEDDRVDKDEALNRLTGSFRVINAMPGGVVHAGLVGEPEGWKQRFRDAFALLDKK